MMPLQDAACAACVSHAFLGSWRCRPDITISRETLGLNKNLHGKDEIARDFNSKVDQILKKTFRHWLEGSQDRFLWL
jgi:hypothetical protein